MDKQITEAPREKTWGALADEAIHNPYVDLAVGVAVGTAVVLSRGRLAGDAERLFPKSSSLLGESIQVDKASADLQAEMRFLDALHELPHLSARPPVLTVQGYPPIGGTSESLLKDHLVELLKKAGSKPASKPPGDI